MSTKPIKEIAYHKYQLGWTERKRTKMTMYTIEKCTNPKELTFGKWFIFERKAVTGWSGCTSFEVVRVVYTASTRKECRAYAETNGIEIEYMDSGRMPSGCKW